MDKKTDVVNTIIALISISFAIYMYLSSNIDNRIDAIINNPEYIKKLAEEVRPTIIFNEKGKILHDSGGLKYIDSNIGVEKNNEKPKENNYIF